MKYEIFVSETRERLGKIQVELPDEWDEKPVPVLRKKLKQAANEALDNGAEVSWYNWCEPEMEITGTYEHSGEAE